VLIQSLLAFTLLTNPADASRENGKPENLAKYNLINAMIFAEHQQWSASSRCMMKLGLLQGVDARPLLPFLESRNEDFRANIASLLGNSGDKRAVKPLIRQLEREQNVDVKLSIIEALGKLKDKRSVKILEQYLSSELWGLRISAATALESITGRKYEFGNPPPRR
jgi:HEAT repeat protein